MSDRDIEPYDFFKRFFGSGNTASSNRFNNLMRNSGWGFFDRDFFRDFEDMEKEMERMFNQFSDISSNAPKELVREYETQEGDKVREVGPIVYGYSMTIGPDGKPKIREFGNVKPTTAGKVSGRSSGIKPQISAEREPLSDVNITDKEVKIVLEMPGIKKDDIKINAYESLVEVIADNPQRKYHKNIELPNDIDIETARSTYNNGILEVTFDKKKSARPKGKEIRIE
ncbi:MAG TPA: archaeal heat shock protein Hsp20 [Candidatus Nitrosocosmicus sp.]|nr:archaeal heat shock protein Hsp20 [Candidatus Nitrosocosmicus sp.]